MLHRPVETATQSSQKDGAQDIFKVAERKTLEMLATNPEPLLPAEVQDQIDEVVRRAQDT